MDCSSHLTMSLSFLQPSSRIKVGVICLHYLVYFLLRPISNGWNVAQRHNRETIRVECRQGKICSLRCVCLQTRQICEVVIGMKSAVEAVKERITNRKCYQRPSRGAEEMDRHHKTGEEQHNRRCSWKELWLAKAVLNWAFTLSHVILAVYTHVCHSAFQKIKWCRSSLAPAGCTFCIDAERFAVSLSMLPTEKNPELDRPAELSGGASPYCILLRTFVKNPSVILDGGSSVCWGSGLSRGFLVRHKTWQLFWK